MFTQESYVRGTEINYFFICKTKLWLFSHNIQMEKENEDVKIGKQIHENSFKRDKKEIRIGPVSFDFVRKRDGKIELHENKKSSKLQEPHKYQVLYYLFFLEKNYNLNAKAIIHYPKERKKDEFVLNDEIRLDLKKILNDINKIKKLEKYPEIKKKKICTKCAYFEFCFVSKNEK